jgi:hypothetical protein
LVRFPPGCEVQARVGKVLGVPAPGRKAVIHCYTEKGGGGGMLKLVDYEVAHGRPGPQVIAECDPDWVEVVQYEDGWTPDVVRAVISGAEA